MNYTVRINPRAKNIILRPRLDGVLVTIPPNTPQRCIEETLEKFKDKLIDGQKRLKENAISRAIDLNYRIETDLFKLTLCKGTRSRFYSQGNSSGEAQIICPPDTDFQSPKMQEMLRRGIETVLKRHAALLLPKRLKELSEFHNLPYTTVKITTSKGRWGSCSIRKSINLSCYLLTLPSHLIDYVMLHELSHTIEMNHGPRFWALLDKLTQGKAKILRKELAITVHS